MRLSYSLGIMILAISFLPSVSAQDETLVTPQPEHKFLERLVGEWKYEKLSIPAEGAEPDNLGTGTVTVEMIGDFFVVSRWSGSLYEMDYQAVQVLGFDTAQKKYSGTWGDSFMSHRWELKGIVDATTSELPLEASGPGPSGGTMTFRERYQFHSADSITIIGEMKQGDQWISFSTTKLARKE